MESELLTSVKLHILVPEEIDFENETYLKNIRKIFDGYELKIRKTKRRELGITVPIYESGMDEFDVTKEIIMDRVPISVSKLEADKWLSFKIFSGDYTSIYFDETFLKFIHDQGISILLNNYAET